MDAITKPMLIGHGAKRILRLDRVRLRGPCGARDEFLLAATAQNLRKLVPAFSSRRRPTSGLRALRQRRWRQWVSYRAPLERGGSNDRRRPRAPPLYSATLSTKSAISGHRKLIWLPWMSLDCPCDWAPRWREIYLGSPKILIFSVCLNR